MMGNLKTHVRPMKKLYVASVIAVLAVAVSACTSGPNYQAPHVAPPTLSVAEHIQLAQQETQWWKKFNDPALNTLVKLSVENNFSLAAAKANVDAAYALFDDVSNNQQVKGTLSTSYTGQDQVTPGPNSQRGDISDITRSYRLGADLSWNADIAGKLKRATEASLADADAQRYALHDLHVSIIAQVVTTYAQMKGAQLRIDVAKRNLETLRKTRTIIAARVDNGFAAELDLHRLDSQLFGVEARIPALTATFERNRFLLLALMGGQLREGVIPPVLMSDVEQGIDNIQLPDLDAPLAIGDPKTLLRRRADVHRAERLLASATASIGVATADLYPDLSITGFLGFLSGHSFSFDKGQQAWDIAPSLSWSAFDLASVRARIDIANAQQQAALANFQQQVVTAIQETQSSLASYAQTQRQRHLLESQVQSSQAALNIAQQQYELGAIDLLDLLDTERSVLAAQDNLAQIKTQTFTIIVDVYQAFGGGFYQTATES